MEALAIASAALSTVGAITQGRAQEAQYRAAQQANDYNTAVLRQRAEMVNQAFGQREDQQRRTNRLEAGKRAAWIGQSGTGFGGSNAAMDEQSAVFAELDALNIRYEGQLESRGLMAQSELESYYGRSNAQNARRARSQTWLNAAGAVLSGGARAYQARGGQ